MKPLPIAVLLAVAVALLLVGVACARGAPSEISWPSTKELVRTTFPKAPQLSVAELAEAIDEGASAPLLIDVREPAEYAVSHLPGAVHAQGDDILKRARQAEPGQKVVLYCSVGYRSSREAEKLLEQGVDNVVNLEGSIFEWANEGHPVVRGDQTVEAVHPFDDEWGQLLDETLRSYEP